MEDEATQPATQITLDPRRLGQGNSGLSDEDAADIVCILVPQTPPATRAAALIHGTAPEHTISFNNNNHVKITEKNAPVQDDTNSGLISCSLALRLSAKLKDPVLGFLFGRSPQRCDFVMGKTDASRRISNVHFRIYINEHGTIMLEDQSTNGTAVDGELLRGKEKENGHRHTQILEGGSVITIIMDGQDDYVFAVRIPQRDMNTEDTYQQNLTAFYLRNASTRQAIAARAAAQGGPVKAVGEPVNLFPPAARGTTTTTTVSTMSSHHKVVREWKGDNEYARAGFLGKGAFATVYKITSRMDGTPYAAKELEKRRFMKNGILDQKVENEMKIMSKIKHANIVQYIKHIDWNDLLYIIMEYVPGGDLGSLISENGRLAELNVKSMASQLLSALKYLHGMNITHRDIKPDNILISVANPFTVKLTDFGLSKMIDSEETFLRTFCGTLLYCAPEVYSEYREYDQTGRRNMRGYDKRSLPPQRYGQAVDIWSLAGVLFYALCAKPPYPVKNGTSYQELLNQIMTEALDIRPLQRVDVSENGIRFVRGMLHRNPSDRATIDELEAHPWLVGGDSMEYSFEEDEEDIITQGYIDPDLEAGTSQLSLHTERQIEQSGQPEDDISDLTEIQAREIPNSFSTEDESFVANRERLFGELGISAVGSSGAIPFSQLDLPHPPDNFHSSMFDSSRETESEYEDASENISLITPAPIATTGPPIVVVPPRIITKGITNRHLDIEDRAARSSSLMGAESMVDRFHVHSPAAASPSADSPAPSIEIHKPEIEPSVSVSLRRPREEDPDDDSGWRPSDFPAKRRRRSEREIDMVVPPNIFWDPKDKSTHHYNYPRMLATDFQAYQKYAESKGERFTHGQKTFEETMQSFRSSRSPSLEPEAASRAHSEPTKEEGRRIQMKRDERILVDTANKTTENDESLPSTAHPSTTGLNIQGEVAPPPPKVISQPVVGNDFQPPKRILAKLQSTQDSCVPILNLNVTDSLLSWGRGYENTSRHPGSTEVRIPKYAFKIMLFKPGYYATNTSARNGHVWKQRDQDMKFYISTKASLGIWVNGTLVPSYEPKYPAQESKFWGELRHGDHITIWRHDRRPEEHTSFRFECYWGLSQEPRKKRDDEFRLLDDATILAELEAACLSEEKAIIADNKRRQEEELQMMQQLKATEKETGPLKFSQSMPRPQSSSS